MTRDDEARRAHLCAIFDEAEFYCPTITYIEEPRSDTMTLESVTSIAARLQAQVDMGQGNAARASFDLLVKRAYGEIISMRCAPHMPALAEVPHLDKLTDPTAAAGIAETV